ncbi:MAG: hypothetical protein BMS9Abin11_0519 [Gammaproteobacteria bacterium]|nr:MAG: hypothetical protein BMS9Abin11_0519 [Gammaproteobacteria bacterium]
MISSIFRYVFLLFCITLIGCAALSTRSKADRFDGAVNTYNSLIKWGDMQTASKYIVNKGQIPKYIDSSIMKNVRVVSYEIKYSKLSGDKRRATVVVEFLYTHDYRPATYRLVDRQRWVFYPGAKVWRVEGKLPSFKFNR